ncbi:hypothetical protein D1AOALGA4SA_8578 [Olavius algarvensis Delta 1 endosymbiont]|nr:hypothetical protein D1AOALGA4SA_8578 [Olavius algarvensis Delta 1 endosymbiont]
MGIFYAVETEFRQYGAKILCTCPSRMNFCTICSWQKQCEIKLFSFYFSFLGR